MPRSSTLAAAALSVAGVLASPIGHLEERQSCPNIHVIGSRETTASPGYGTAGVVVNLVLQAFPGATAEALNYPACGGQSSCGGQSYSQSVQTGTQALAQLVNSFNAKCPNTQIVLVGYSQGGEISDNAVCGGNDTPSGVTSTSSNTINSQALAQVKAVIEQGSPRFVAGSSYNVGTCKTKGFSARPQGYECPSASKIQSYCDSADPYCCTGNDANTHQGYGKEYGQAALTFIKSKLSSSNSAGNGAGAGAGNGAAAGGGNGAGAGAGNGAATGAGAGAGNGAAAGAGNAAGNGAGAGAGNAAGNGGGFGGGNGGGFGGGNGGGFGGGNGGGFGGGNGAGSPPPASSAPVASDDCDDAPTPTPTPTTTRAAAVTTPPAPTSNGDEDCDGPTPTPTPTTTADDEACDAPTPTTTRAAAVATTTTADDEACDAPTPTPTPTTTAADDEACDAPTPTPTPTTSTPDEACDAPTPTTTKPPAPTPGDEACDAPGTGN